MPVVDTAPGFKYEGRLSGGPDLFMNFTFKDTETLTKGDLLNLESGLADLAATNDTGFIGVARETKAGTSAVSTIEAHYAPDAIYSVYDPVARLPGATLDISGATGAMTVTTTSNADVIVIGGFSASERTLVMIIAGEHFLDR
jgi:hypothetical protein